MKDYEEIAKNVLRRGLQEMEKERRRKKMLVRGGCSAAAIGLVAVVSVGAFWGKGRQQDSAGQLANLENMAAADDVKNPELGGAFTGDVLGEDGFGIDGGQGGFSGKDETMDGDPAGYGTSGGKDAADILGDPAGYEPVPGGKTEEGQEGELDWESIKDAPVENSMPATVEEASSPNHKDTTDMDGQLPGGASIGEASATEEGTVWPEELKEMISSYPEDAVYCYAAPGNGEFFCSVPLKHAMEEYGDDALYHVVVELFCDGGAVNPVSEKAKYEWERMAELGYKVVRKNYDDGEKSGNCFMLQATKKQLEEFAVSEEFGYMFRFFDEP